MEVTILGSGSCYGVPTVGGEWGDCDPKNPKNMRTVASIMVQQGNAKILIDMSPDFREHSIKHDLTDLSAILFTHGHADHILGNFHLPRLMQYYKNKKLPLYADRATQEDIEHMFWFQMQEGGKVQYSYGGETHWELLEPFKEFVIGDMKILPLPQDHGAIKSFAFRIGNFAYSTDFNHFSSETLDKLQGLDCWIVECNRKDNGPSHSGGHLYLEKVLSFIDKVKPKKAYLTHLNISMDYDAISAILPENVHLAYDGLKLDIPKRIVIDITDEEWHDPANKGCCA